MKSYIIFLAKTKKGLGNDKKTILKFRLIISDYSR